MEIIASNLPYNLRNSFDLANRPNDIMVQVTRILNLFYNREQHHELRGNNRAGENSKKNNSNKNSNENSQRNRNSDNGNGGGKQLKIGAVCAAVTNRMTAV